MAYTGNHKLSVSSKSRVVVLTGAGISLESGVPIFRGNGSMWDIPEVRRLASRAGPPWNTRETWEFYEWRRQLVSRCKPNAAHYTLVDMENFFRTFHVITQNVDGLHSRAGNKKVFELHGNMWKGRCTRCSELVELYQTPLKRLPPYCKCGGALRPDVVQFGEPLDAHILRNAVGVCKEAKLLLVIGTSGVVSPASHMPLVAREHGAKVIEINPYATALTSFMHCSIRGKAAHVLPQLWRKLRKLNIKV
jgi:NAD-dependent deacetylase